MKKINEIINDYNFEISEIQKSDLKMLCKTRESIKLSLHCLHALRLKIRKDDFSSTECEIDFFKHQKPYICGNLQYYKSLTSFHTEKPAGDILTQRKYIYKLINKLENKKRKDLDFYKYCKQEEVSFDEKYFIRSNNQLHLFSNYKYTDNDPQFSTTHDLRAAEIYSYDLLTSFYTQELSLLKIIDEGVTIKEVTPAIFKDLFWIASKTDLIEMIYALYAAVAIRHGKVGIKKVVKVCEFLFGIDLGNYHKTFAEIKAGEKDPTKFLDRLRAALRKLMGLDS
jgi:hypothetical protein